MIAEATSAAVRARAAEERRAATAAAEAKAAEERLAAIEAALAAAEATALDEQRHLEEAAAERREAERAPWVLLEQLDAALSEIAEPERDADIVACSPATRRPRVRARSR